MVTVRSHRIGLALFTCFAVTKPMFDFKVPFKTPDGVLKFRHSNFAHVWRIV